MALATIADVVPLIGENRTLVRRGLRALAATRKPGLRALMAVARVDPARVDERSVGFALAPRMNAAGPHVPSGRGTGADPDRGRARAAQIAAELDRANAERRQVETRIRFEAEAQIAALGERAAYVLAGEDWHAGVIGIVASRLAERHHRPVVLIALDGERGRGSGRSIEAFDLLAALGACGEHLLRHGGHRAAAGLEIERARVERFAPALDAHAGRVLAAEDLVAVERVDAIVGGEELGMELAEELQSAGAVRARQPGRVADARRGARFRDARPMGEGKHVRFTVQSRGVSARAVAFGTGGRLPVAEDAPAEATFTLEVNEWSGVCEPRLVLRHAVAAPSPIEAARLSPPIDADEQREQPDELVLFASREAHDALTRLDPVGPSPTL